MAPWRHMTDRWNRSLSSVTPREPHRHLLLCESSSECCTVRKGFALTNKKQTHKHKSNKITRIATCLRIVTSALHWFTHKIHSQPMGRLPKKQRMSNPGPFCKSRRELSNGDIVISVLEWGVRLISIEPYPRAARPKLGQLAARWIRIITSGSH